MAVYDVDLTEVDLTTSHGQILDLVGFGKDVLDVGCATGYLARALTARGCRVSGVELDTSAAAAARPVLQRLVVGDLAEVDLVAEFGRAAFDVVVFGDVLEHLADPLAVLRAALPLVRVGGSVVVSIPNVSHAAVRLALLNGEFRYRDLGLLDRTHIHFFTRESMGEMLRSAGLIPLDMRRTVAGFFDTEIQVDPDTVPGAVLDALRTDPDADTYQFVFRAVLDDAVQGGADLAARNERLQFERIALSRDIARLQRELDEARADLDVERRAVQQVTQERAAALAAVDIQGQTLAHAEERIAQLQEWLTAPRWLARRLASATVDRVLGADHPTHRGSTRRRA